MIRKIFILASFGFLSLFFFSTTFFVLMDYYGFDEPPGTDQIEFDIGGDSNQMRINANDDAEFMMWYSSKNDKFDRFIGRFEGGDRVEVDDGNLFTVYEVSNNRYTADTGRYRGTLDLPVIREEVDGSRTLEYDTHSIASSVTTELETGSRVEHINGSYVDYNVDIIGDEQNLEVEFSPDMNYWSSNYVAISTVGDVDYEITSLEVNGEEKEVSNYGQLDEWITLNESSTHRYDLYEWETEMIDDSDSLSMELKVIEQNDNLNGINPEDLTNSDGVFVLFMDSDYYATINNSGKGYQDESGNILGYQQDYSSPYGGEEGVSIGVN